MRSWVAGIGIAPEVAEARWLKVQLEARSLLPAWPEPPVLETREHWLQKVSQLVFMDHL